jgi:hypothetical protein
MNVPRENMHRWPPGLTGPGDRSGGVSGGENQPTRSPYLAGVAYKHQVHG